MTKSSHCRKTASRTPGVGVPCVDARCAGFVSEWPPELVVGAPTPNLDGAAYFRNQGDTERCRHKISTWEYSENEEGPISGGSERYGHKTRRAWRHK